MRIPTRVRAIELPQFDLLNDLAQSWRARGADVIALGQALPGFPPPPEAVDALRRALDETSSHIYSSDAGVPELREALAASLQPLGAQVDPAQEIIITAGGNQAFQLIVTTLVDPGDEVVLASPYFLNHQMAVRAVGGVPVEAPTRTDRGFAPTWDDLEPHVTPRTRAVVVVSPSNPTGAVAAPSEIRRMAAECAVRNLVLIADETYLRFTYDTAPSTALALAEWRESVVVVGSFSKSYAITGWRCGYLVAPAPVIAEAMKVQDCMVICAPVPIQRAVAEVLERVPDYPRRWVPELRRRRDFLVSALAAIPGVEPVRPSGGFFVMAKFGEMTDSRATALALIDQEHVVTIPGIFFGQAGEGYLRISYGAASEDRLREATHRLSRSLIGRPPVARP